MNMDMINQSLSYALDKEAKFLELTIINSPLSSATGTTILINSEGIMNGSMRNKKDSFTYFGFISDLNNPAIEEDDMIDYQLPKKINTYRSEITPEDNKNEGRFFQIHYKEDLKGFYLKDLGKGLGTFIKIKDSLLLKDSTLISLGDSFIVVNFENEESYQYNNERLTVESKLQGIGKKIILRVYEGKNATTTKDYYFLPSRDIMIRIGRKRHNNEIELDDNLVSKVNANIQYNDYEGWVIRDGNEIRNSNGSIQRVASTNGTWFLPVDDFRIYDGMVFKGNFILFCCNLINNIKA